VPATAAGGHGAAAVAARERGGIVTDSKGQWTEPDVPPAAPGPDLPAAVTAAQPPVAPVGAVARPDLVYGEVTGRFIAIIVDGILVVVVSGILQVVAGLVFGPAIHLTPVTTDVGDINYATVLIGAVIGIVVSFAYFVVLWTRQRATLGMRVLALEVVSDRDGGSLVTDRATLRWLVLFGPFALSQAFWPLPGIGQLIGLASIAWAAVLLVTTAMSPTRQGLHDRVAHTLVVKVTRRMA
jgi:uncharacterized RDD family membrane protein YckC